MAVLDPNYKGPKLSKKELTEWKISNAMKQAEKYRQESARYGGGSTMGAANYVAGKVVDNPLVSLRGASDVFSSAIARKMVAPEAKRFIEEPTKAQLGGAVAQTALTLYPGATIAKAGRFATGSLLGKIASRGAEKAVTGAATNLAKSNISRGLAKLAGNVASFGGAGYGYEASQNLIEGKTGAEAYTPGMQTAVSAALPFTPIVFTGAKNALGRATQEAFGATTGAGMGVVRMAYEAAKEGGEKAAAFTKAMRGNTSPEEIVGAAKESLGEIIQKRSTAYEQALSKVAGMTEQIDTTPVEKAIESGLKKFGVEVTQDGLDFSRSTLRFNKKAQEEIRTIVDEMAGFGSKEGDNTALGVDRLKRAFSDLYSDSSEARAFVANVTGETRKLLSKVPGYDEMAKAYGDSTGLIKEIQKGLSLGNKASIDTAFRKLSTTLRTNNEFRQQLVAELDKISGGTLSAQIAGQQMSEWMPRGLSKVALTGGGAIGLATGGLGVVALLKLAATTSPRIIGEFANALGVGARAFNKFLKGIGIKAGVDAIQKTRLPGDIFLDSPFGKKLKEGVQSMKGKGGLSIQDISKGKAGYSDNLLQEARKYKSAEEFVNSFNLMKSGEVTSIGQLPISKVNKTQIRAITERGLPHTDTGLKVKDFTPGRKVTQPLEVYSKGGSYVVENGNHRLAQALANGDTHIPVVFKRGEGKTYSTHTKSQLTDLWKKAHQGGDSLDPLKYKSAEEFVKAQGEPLYHGSDKAAVIEKEGFKLMPDRGVSAYGDGAYLTTSKSDAKGWGGMVSGYVPKDLKLAKVPSNEPYTVNTKKLIQEGYDGVEVGYGDKQHIVLFDPSKIKTKSQLTDLWKKATKKKGR